MMRNRFQRSVVLLALAASFTGGPGGSPWAQELEESELDCVIEPKQVVELGSAEEGIIREIMVDRGDIVQAGDVVARLDFELERLAAELARLKAERDVEVRSSRARLEFRQREAGRAEELHRKKIVSTKVHDEAKIEQQLAQLGVRAAQMDRRVARVEQQHAQARLDRRTIRSPVNGVVVELMMSPGEFVHEQTPVVTIAQVDPLNVEVFVPIMRYETIRPGVLAKVMPDPPVGGDYKARVEVVDRVFDTASGTFGVRLVLPNPDYRLPAGTKCRVRFLPGEPIVADAEPSADDKVEEPSAGPGNAVSPDTAEEADTGATTADSDADNAVSQTVGNATDVAAEAPQRDDLVYLIQAHLTETGFDTGPPDGVFGPRTRGAIEAYQRQNDFDVDGRATWNLLAHLQRETVPETKKEGEDKGVEASENLPSSGYDNFRQASEASKSGEIERAITLYTEAIESGDLPQQYLPYAFNNRGLLRQNLGLYEQALEDYDKAIRLKPDNVSAYVGRGEVKLGRKLYRGAIEDFDRALELDRDHARAYHSRGVAFANLGEIERAIADYDTAIRLQPGYSAPYFSRAIAYENLGEVDLAIADYARLYSLRPDYPGLGDKMKQLGVSADGTISAPPAQ